MSVLAKVDAANEDDPGFPGTLLRSCHRAGAQPHADQVRKKEQNLATGRMCEGVGRPGTEEGWRTIDISMCRGGA